MDDRLLAAFCAVAEHGSLTRAAAGLGEAPSVLSRRIAALEARLRGRLFHRTGRGVVPTELGLRLLPRARAILGELEALAADAADEVAAPAGRVDLAVVPGMSRPLIAELCAQMRREQPRIRLSAIEAYSGDVEAWLASGRVDIGIFNRYGGARVRNGELLMQADLRLVIARPPRGLASGDVAFRTLRDIPLALPGRPNALVARLGDLALRHGIALDIAFEAGSGALIKDAVMHAGLATLVPDQVARRDYADASIFDVRRVVKPSIRQRAWLATTTHRPPTLAVRLVGQTLRRLATRTSSTSA